MGESRNSLIFTTIAIVAVGAVIIGSFYFYSKNNSKDLGSNQRLVSGSRLAVETETAKLAELERRYKAERAVIGDINSEYLKIRNNILQKTDIFFSNPNSNNPKITIKIKDKKLEADINNQRLQVTKLLKIWEERYNIIENDLPTIVLLPSLPDMAKQAKEDIAYIQHYLETLKSIIGDLSPEDSGISQNQIDYYESVIASNSKDIENVISNIALAETHSIEIYTTNVATTTPIIVAAPTSTTPTPTPPPVVTPPIVTDSQIAAQQEVVTEAEENQNNEDENNNGNNDETPETPPPPPTSDNGLPAYYMYFESSPSPTTAKYLPNPFADHTGWPDIVPNTNSSVPSLLDGANTTP